MDKAPFDVERAIRLIEDAVRPYPKAALFELAEEGFGSPFEQLVACIISIRTRDEVTLPVARRLFARACTPADMAALDPDLIYELIRGSQFREGKARHIHAIARRCLDDFGGDLPCDPEVMQRLPGVGPKCANLAAGIACGATGIGVDVHVHRVTNRWGHVASSTPEQTMSQLEAKLPRDLWLDINRLLVPFGKHMCTGRLPHCSTCPVENMCQQVGVAAHR